MGGSGESTAAATLPSWEKGDDLSLPAATGPFIARPSNRAVPALPLGTCFPQLCELLGSPALCGMSSTPELCCGDRRRAATVPKIPHNPPWLPRGFSVGAGGRGDQCKTRSQHRAVWGAVLCLAWLRALQLLCCTLALSRGRFKQV